MPSELAPADEIAERLLDAAVEAATIHGITRLSMSDVATRAGVSRPTLYKRFSSKDELVAAAVLREANAMIDAVLAAAEPFEDPADALEAAVLVSLRLTRDHPLLDRIVRTEPETLVPLLVADPSPVLAFGRAAAERVIATKAPELSEVGTRRLADALLRLLISYALTPPDDPPEIVAASIAAVLTSGLDERRPLTRTVEDR